MAINLNVIGTRDFFLKEQIFSSLTWKQRKLLFVATVALTCLAILYIYSRYCFKASLVKAKDETHDNPDPSYKLETTKTDSLKQVENLKTENSPVILPKDHPPSPKSQDESRGDQNVDDYRASLLGAREIIMAQIVSGRLELAKSMQNIGMHEEAQDYMQRQII